jgi:phosphoglycerate dehydrogenase-like enzyme
MNVILLQITLLAHEVDLLLKEFPQYLIFSLSEASYKNLTPQYWENIEILFGSRLTSEELSKAQQLHWIHCPSANLSRLCLEDIQKKRHLLVSTTLEENIPQIGEFVMGAMLAFSKNLFAWKDMQATPSLLWDSKWRHSMNTLQDKVFLQIGVTRPSQEIARHARHFNMRVVGIESKPSFHPHYHKIVGYEALSEFLPQADVISIHMAKKIDPNLFLSISHLEQIKPGAILILLGSTGVVNEEDLALVSKSGKFRGVLIDANYRSQISDNSPLWDLPNLIITPEVSPRPKSTERTAFRIFLYNLRQYVYGNYKDMRHLMHF